MIVHARKERRNYAGFFQNVRRTFNGQRNQTSGRSAWPENGVGG